jgi:hypothetical protein
MLALRSIFLFASGVSALPALELSHVSPSQMISKLRPRQSFLNTTSEVIWNLYVVDYTWSHGMVNILDGWNGTTREILILDRETGSIAVSCTLIKPLRATDI